LSAFEQPIAVDIVELGTLKTWEFAAFLETQVGPLIEFITRMTDDGADPSSDVLSAMKRTGKVVVHHNHLSQESLSFADWTGLTVIAAETFAHCADGTIYWGRVLDIASVGRILDRAIAIETEGENSLFELLGDHPAAISLSAFFRKEVVNRAMRLKGFVEYEVEWGTQAATPNVRPGSISPPGSAGNMGRTFHSYIDAAASNLANKI
jgi:hypothetical protein